MDKILAKEGLRSFVEQGLKAKNKRAKAAQKDEARAARSKTATWRVVLRVSYEDDKNSALRNKLLPILGACGITQRVKNTGTWRGAGLDRAKVSQQLALMLHALSKSGDLDHVWFLIEQEV